MDKKSEDVLRESGEAHPKRGERVPARCVSRAALTILWDARISWCFCKEVYPSRDNHPRHSRLVRSGVFCCMCGFGAQNRSQLVKHIKNSEFSPVCSSFFYTPLFFFPLSASLLSCASFTFIIILSFFFLLISLRESTQRARDPRCYPWGGYSQFLWDLPPKINCIIQYLPPLWVGRESWSPSKGDDLRCNHQVVCRHFLCGPGTNWSKTRCKFVFFTSLTFPAIHALPQVHGINKCVCPNAGLLTFLFKGVNFSIIVHAENS